MPEVLTKHPGVVIDVLESGGARCGDGLPQKILTQCPREAFCVLPGGEMCVYGITEVSEMTQIREGDLAPLVCAQSAGGCDVAGMSDATALFAISLLGLIILLYIITRRRARGRAAAP